ncbi:NADH-quinone oxidoreductase subunit J [bacterium BMS3Bbin06]|nr:NADH-quinone oxidoreductase subunit J [bacterium BMS3Bbin06]HDO35729.1 NADH-quinone oxidoreductase subunit J [Nitrospirota bacterium]
MVEFLFGYLAFAVIVFSLLVVLSRNAIHAVLWMLVMFFHVAALYLLLQAEFLAAVQIIVYAGAILVLFLFAIMLLNLKEELTAKQLTDGWPVGLSVALGIFLTLLMALNGLSTTFKGRWSIDEIKRVTYTKALGEVLFTKYIFPFEIASLVLLVAIIGVVVLAKKRLKA